jgi:hypothetical protein
MIRAKETGAADEQEVTPVGWFAWLRVEQKYILT